jgi:hypothetical protein
MDEHLAQLDCVGDLESRQDDVLRRLAELDAAVERALAEWLPVKTAGRD